MVAVRAAAEKTITISQQPLCNRPTRTKAISRIWLRMRAVVGAFTPRNPSRAPVNCPHNSRIIGVNRLSNRFKKMGTVVMVIRMRMTTMSWMMMSLMGTKMPMVAPKGGL